MLPHEFEGNAEMVPEVEVFAHVDDVVLSILVFAPQSVQDFHFHQRLMMKPVQHDSTIHWVIQAMYFSVHTFGLITLFWRAPSHCICLLALITRCSRTFSSCLPLFVANDFDGCVRSCFVIVAFDDLTKRAFTQDLHCFVAVRQVITNHLVQLR